MTLADRIKSQWRMRLGFGIAAVVLPLVFFIGGKRARELDALAAKGVAVQATVTDISRVRETGGGPNHTSVFYVYRTSYAYSVNGVGYTGSTDSFEKHHAVGDALDVTYLPSDPSMNRPYTDRHRIAEDAADLRRLGSGIGLGMLWLFGFISVVAHRELQRLRGPDPPERSDVAAMRRRVALTWIALVPLIVLFCVDFTEYALERGVSLAGPALTLGSTLLVFGGLSYIKWRTGLVWTSWF